MRSVSSKGIGQRNRERASEKERGGRGGGKRQRWPKMAMIGGKRRERGGGGRTSPWILRDPQVRESRRHARAVNRLRTCTRDDNTRRE